MADIFQKIGAVVDDAGTDVVKGVQWVAHLYTVVESKLQVIEKDEPTLVSSVSDLVVKGEAFLAATAPAITAEGLSIPADSAAFAALKAFLASFEQAANALKQVVVAAKQA
jgi:hypothetical protein